MESHESLLTRDASGLRIWSCVTCRRRKVRCDRVDPACNNCLRTGIECHYPVTGRVPRRRGPEIGSRVPAPPPRTGAQKQAELISRLRKLEAVVTEMSTQVEQGIKEQGLGENYTFRFHHPKRPASLSASTPSMPESQTDGSCSSQVDSTTPSSRDEMEDDFGPIVKGKDGALQIGNRFWTVFCNEADSVFQMMEDITNDDGYAGEETAGSNPATSSLGITPGSPPIDELHLSNSQLTMLWETYVGRVDAFIKILHLPTVESIYRSLPESPISTLSLETNALISAISLAAIVSMDEDDIITHFNAPKSEAIYRLRKTTEQALTNADYLTTRNMVTLQAFTIYVATLPYLGSTKLAYTLIGSLTRLAVSIGLHKDSSRNANLSFMDMETRRRLWWQICFIDSSSRDPSLPAEVFITKDMFDTAIPSIIDDQDLTMATKELRSPEFKSGQKMTLCWVRSQIWGAMRSIRPVDSLQACLDQLDSCRSYIEKQCLQHLRLDVPFDAYIRTMAKLAFSKIETTLLTKRLRKQQGGTGGGGADQMEIGILRSQLFAAALNVVEAAYALRSRSDWRDWRWHLQGHVPWNAMGITLHHMKRQLWSSSSERAWVAIKGLYDMLGEEAKAEAPWAGIAELVAKTGSYRERSSSYGLSGTTTTGFYPHDIQNMVDGNLAETIAQTSDPMIEVPNDDHDDHSSLNFDPTFAESGDWQYWADLIDMDLTF